MSFRNLSSLPFVFLVGALLSGCASTRQIAIDHPETQVQPFHPLKGFQAIDGDDYYIRLTSKFDYKGDTVLKSGCSNITPSYEKNDLSAALIFSVNNDTLKFKGDAAGFLYQATTGKCNFRFDAKKLYLTPWIRLDTGKETSVDYNFYTNANSDLDVSGLVGDVNTASSLLALTGVGMGVAIMGQVAGHWVNNQDQNQSAPEKSSVKHSSESHSLPALAAFTAQSGKLNHILFKVYEVEEGGLNILGPETRQLGELHIFPEILPSLLLKTSADGIPDARDLSFEELSFSPIKSAAGDINLQQLIEQSKHSAKPNLNPNWNKYAEVESNCRNLKLVLKELGFNKFDRNAILYYYLAKSGDWKNYNISRQKALNDEIRPAAMKNFRNNGFGNCLAEDDYAVMKAMGLSVNTSADWDQIGENSLKKEQLFTPIKSIERQLLAVLKNNNVAEMERQLYPLLTTVKNGDGTVLLQNHLGDFGLETLLNPPTTPAPSAGNSVNVTKPVAPLAETKPSASDQSAGQTPSLAPVKEINPEVSAAPIKSSTPTPASVAPIPGEGIIVTVSQLARVFAGLSISELSCSRPVPNLQGKQPDNTAILLFTTKEGSPRAKGGAMEYEFSAGKIIRIAFQLPTFRDFEQDILERPEVGGCRIEASFLSKLH